MHPWNRLPALALLGAAALPTGAAADVRRPDGQPLPTAPKQHPRIKGRPDFVYLAYDGAVLRELPSRTAPPVQPVPPVRFMQDFAWSAEAGNDPAAGRWVLLVTTDPSGQRVARSVGWVEGKYLVRGERALRDPVFKLELKGLIVNPPEVFAREQRGGTAGAAPVRLAPKPGAREVEPFTLYKLFFVYGEAD